MNAAFIDASYLIAFMNPRDAWHAQAVAFASSNGREFLLEKHSSAALPDGFENLGGRRWYWDHSFIRRLVGRGT